jgi:hypothetical protein
MPQRSIYAGLNLFRILYADPIAAIDVRIQTVIGIGHDRAAEVNSGFFGGAVRIVSEQASFHGEITLIVKDNDGDGQIVFLGYP